MRTTFDIPDELLEEARRVAHARSKREAVLAGLEELIKKGRREELRQLAGKVDIRVDLQRSRKRRPR
jgi:Arc/MetJ family transcription regulator